jgi:hypothetical protein
MTDQPLTVTTDIEIHLTIPTDGSGRATLVGKKGDLGKLSEVAYASAQDLADAIEAMAYDLMALELEPPPSYDAPQAEASPQGKVRTIQASLPGMPEELGDEGGDALQEDLDAALDDEEGGGYEEDGEQAFAGDEPLEEDSGDAGFID